MSYKALKINVSITHLLLLLDVSDGYVTFYFSSRSLTYHSWKTTCLLACNKHNLNSEINTIL